MVDLIVGKLYSIGDVRFIVRSIDRAFYSELHGLSVTYTAQTLDTLDVYTDFLDSANIGELKSLHDLLDKAYNA